MKWKDVKGIPFRIKGLITRRLVWVDVDNGTESVEYVSFHTAWNIFGIQTYRWWWVTKWGTLSCGCTRNPLTRRLVAVRFGCEEHCGALLGYKLAEEGSE